MQTERIGGIDLRTLPPDPLPPDTWQDQAACYGVEPDLFFPVSEEEAGPALAYCVGCQRREHCLDLAQLAGVAGGENQPFESGSHGGGHLKNGGVQPISPRSLQLERQALAPDQQGYSAPSRILHHDLLRRPLSPL